MLNTSIKSTETTDDHSVTLYLQSEINFCSVRMPDVTSPSRTIINTVLS